VLFADALKGASPACTLTDQVGGGYSRSEGWGDDDRHPHKT